MNKICVNYIISGKVQGVWFRANTQKKAQELGVTGWVKNLPNGDVEVTACGDASAIEKLHSWLQQGPENAHVDNVESHEIDLQDFEKFDIHET